MSEAEIAYELVRQGVWTPEDLKDWLHDRCRNVFRYAWRASRESTERAYETKGESK